jgi:hypothetical protein
VPRRLPEHCRRGGCSVGGGEWAQTSVLKTRARIAALEVRRAAWHTFLHHPATPGCLRGGRRTPAALQPGRQPAPPIHPPGNWPTTCHATSRTQSLHIEGSRMQSLGSRNRDHLQRVEGHRRPRGSVAKQCGSSHRCKQSNRPHMQCSTPHCWRRSLLPLPRTTPLFWGGQLLPELRQPAGEGRSVAGWQGGAAVVRVRHCHCEVLQRQQGVGSQAEDSSRVTKVSANGQC